ncbi:MAG: TolC family protein [Bacteroidia bacterium]
MNIRIQNLITFFILCIVQNNFFGQSKVWTLQNCLDQAIEKNVLLNQEKLGTDINSINLEQSKANIYPNLNLAENQNFSFGRAIDPVSYQFLNQNISSNNLSLNSSVTVFNGLQNYYTIKQNQYYYNAGVFDIEKAKNDLSLAVVGDYLEILYNYEAVDIAKTQVETSASEVERMQKYIDAGKVAIGNLYQIQSQLAADKYSEINAENQLQLAKVNLMQLMEMPVSDDFEIVRPALGEPELTALNPSTDIYKIAEGNQPQIKSAALKINSADAGLKVSQGALWPKLSLSGNLKTAYSSARNQVSYQTVAQQQTIGYLQKKGTKSRQRAADIARCHSIAPGLGIAFLS